MMEVDIGNWWPWELGKHGWGYVWSTLSLDNSETNDTMYIRLPDLDKDVSWRLIELNTKALVQVHVLIQSTLHYVDAFSIIAHYFLDLENVKLDLGDDLKFWFDFWIVKLTSGSLFLSV